MIFHSAPRILKWNNWFSETVTVSRGILSGTRKSNTFARIFLYPILRDLHFQLPTRTACKLNIFVDDIALNVYGKLEHIVHDAAFVASRLFQKLTSAKLIVSPKSTAIASSRYALAELAVKF